MSEHFVDISPLRMVWSRPDDRWRHRFDWIGEHEPRVWAESVEGSSSDEWPPGPVFQDLFVEPKADGAVEFQLMGQCGKTIYTAAVLCDPPRGRIEFDVCARVRREPPSPGLVSTYRCEPPVHSQESLILGPRFVVNDETGVGGQLDPDGRLWTVGRFLPLTVDSARGTLYRWRYAVACR